MANVIPFPPQPRPAAALRPAARASRVTPVDFLRLPLLPVLRRFEADPVVPARPSSPSRPVTLRS